MLRHMCGTTSSATSTATRYNARVGIAPIALIIGASLVPLIIGFLWYHPRVLGHAWMRLMNITPEMAERGEARRGMRMLVTLVAGIVTAYVIYRLLGAWETKGAIGALEIGVLAWLGLMVPTSLGDIIWEQKPVQLYLIDAGYWLCTLLLMSLLLSI